MLVKEEAHDSGWRPEGAPLTLSCVRQAGFDVLTRKLGKLSQDLFFGHAASQVSKNVADRDPRATDARLAEPDGWIDADPIKEVRHGMSVREPPMKEQSARRSASRRDSKMELAALDAQEPANCSRNRPLRPGHASAATASMICDSAR